MSALVRRVVAAVKRFPGLALAFLTPTRRKAFYGLVTAVGGALVVAGVVTPDVAASYGSLVIAAFEVGSMVLGSFKARRWDWKAIYGVLAALVAGLKVVGWITPGQESYILDLLAHGIAIVPLVALFVRTDPRTATGEPSSEVVADAVLPTAQLAADEDS